MCSNFAFSYRILELEMLRVQETTKSYRQISLLYETVDLRDKNNFIGSGHATQWHVPLQPTLSNTLTRQERVFMSPELPGFSSQYWSQKPGLSPGKEEVPGQKQPSRVKSEGSVLSI